MQTFGYMGLHPCKHGVFAINENDTFIGKSMRQYGQWCEGELDLVLPYLSPQDIAIDCGANIGTHTVPLAKACGLVIAFEPQRLIFQNLCTNITLNNLVNVRPFNAAVSDAPGAINVPALDPRQKFNFGALSLFGSEGEQVPVMTIDQLGLGSCKLIKVDVEGFEANVLRGAAQTIQRCKPVLFVENDKEDGSAEILQLLEQLGYDAWWHFCPYEEPNNFNRSNEPFWEGLPPAINLLCLPKGSQAEGLLKVNGPNDTWEHAYRRLKDMT